MSDDGDDEGDKEAPGPASKTPNRRTLRDSGETEWIGQTAPAKRASAPIVVQPPRREPVPESDQSILNVQAVETMGVSVLPPTFDEPTVTVANTSTETEYSDRFVAFDASLLDDLIDALEEAKRRQKHSIEKECWR
jgi:hypothetical protein